MRSHSCVANGSILVTATCRSTTIQRCPWLLFDRNNSYVNASQYYVRRTLPVVLFFIGILYPADLITSRCFEIWVWAANVLRHCVVYLICTLYYPFSGFGGLVVSMLASGTQDRGFDPGRSRRIFRAKKSTA